MRAVLLTEYRGLFDEQATYVLSSQIADAAAQYRRDPEEVHYSSAAAAVPGAHGGMNKVVFSALLIWRD